MNRVQLDECPDANGFYTIRYFDGSPNGDTERPVIATVYDYDFAKEIVYQLNHGLL